MSEVARSDVENIRMSLFRIAEAFDRQHDTQQMTNEILKEIRDALKKEGDGDRAVVLGDS